MASCVSIMFVATSLKGCTSTPSMICFTALERLMSARQFHTPLGVDSGLQNATERDTRLGRQGGPLERQTRCSRKLAVSIALYGMSGRSSPASSMTSCSRPERRVRTYWSRERASYG
ncbi:hypothetical protein BD626DRAFT_492708 [Schizophyllum amplum]|uniref:Uncharacterized protein n=1 Tax=Schizophyllum amplum TaxID=97359 RepID=A0A550CG59_9AGAR|nr:hypothetical protein BD626DRAFT_492708 [Auriculariopsis ampla]